MKKIIISMAVLAAMTTAQALNYDVMAGFEFGQAKASSDEVSLEEEWQDSFGGRVGVETKESRIYGSYHYIDSDIDNSGVTYETHVLSLNLEAKTKAYYKILRAFVGGHIGAIYSDLQTPLVEQDDTDLIYGAQAGILVDITENIYLETGYRHSWTNAGDDSVNPDTVQSYYGAINLKF